ncbi:uncharacterized protein METZ01_LOCUS137751, partial [marine metagenome]
VSQQRSDASTVTAWRLPAQRYGYLKYGAQTDSDNQQHTQPADR